MALNIPAQLNIASWFIDRPAQEYPDRIAILGGPTPIHYRELHELTNRFGNALKIMGCAPGERVLIVLPDSVEFVAAFFGTTKIGAVAVPVNPLAKSADFSYYVTDSDARIAVVHVSIVSTFLNTLSEDRRPRLILVGGDSQTRLGSTWETCVGDASPILESFPTAAHDSACFLYTSGSTGLQKAVVHPHKSMFVTTRSFADSVLSIGPSDRTFSVSKLFFAYGLGNAMYFPLSAGASTVLNPDRSRLDTVSELLTRYRPTLFFAVPTFFRAILQEAANGFLFDFSSVRIAVSAGELLPPEIFDEFRNRFRLEILDSIGSTEMFQAFMSNRPDAARAGTCGFEVPNYEVRLVGDDGAAVSEGEIGTLWLKGESQFTAYWKKPELTEQTKIGEWVVTGDQFYRDSDGYYHFCGRRDDMLKLAGMWISPVEIENVIRAHPDVERAVVLATDAFERRKRTVAFVKTKGGAETDVREIWRYLQANLSEHMWPAQVFVLPEFPLTPNGKVDRQALLLLVGKREHELNTSESCQLPTPTEMQLMEIWSAILDVDRVGIYDNFVELGGDSIDVMRCLNRVREAFGVDPSFSAFFGESVNLKSLAEAIDEQVCVENPIKQVAPRVLVEESEGQ
jgi:benzoate-CoA ligase family protein